MENLTLNNGITMPLIGRPETPELVKFSLTW